MIHWGILGTGKVAGRFAESVRKEPSSILSAVSGRSEEKARNFAEKHGITRSYDSYDSMLLDPEIDAVYIALPHICHKEWALKCLQANKAVLCEKPAVMSAEEMEEIISAAQSHNVLFMEAMKPRFVPLYDDIKQKINSGYIGELVGIEASLCNLLPARESGSTYHTQPEQGGALLDCGIYCASWLEDFCPEEMELERIYAAKKDGIDFYVDAWMKGSQVYGRLECAFDRTKPRKALIRGTEGYMEIEELHRPERATIYRKGHPQELLERKYENDDFYGEIHHFALLIEQGKKQSPVMPLNSSLRCARILDIIKTGLSYSQKCLDILQVQENTLQYDSFGSREALKLGVIASSLAEEYDRTVGINITREADGLVLFQYMMDEKTSQNLYYMEGKRQAVLESNHCSLWPRAENAVNGRWQSMIEHKTDALASGGAFPIRVKGKHVATISVSGLHEGKDHELVVRALSSALGRPVSDLPCVAI